MSNSKLTKAQSANLRVRIAEMAERRFGPGDVPGILRLHDALLALIELRGSRGASRFLNARPTSAEDIQ